MNYLAHLSLAREHPDSLTGNLMGDFMKGVDMAALPPAIQAGIHNHRAVDRFTDRHPAVLALRPLFSARYRRFAGIMLDVGFDYFLTRHWSRFHAVPRADFIRQSYDGLLAGLPWMPQPMQFTVQRMAANDWLSAYDDFARVGFALDRIAERIRFPNDFAGSARELIRHQERIEAVFLALYPALQQHVDVLGLENSPDRA
ncbi:MAG TPA: ACP phosphodiesterase [Thiolinea sp.]|nr:ACP phosphodiesterase [Thiolinea sp.]